MIHNQTDVELTHNLQNDIESEASLQELVNRHSGIFLDIVNNYIPNTSPTSHKQDINGCVLTNITKTKNIY